MYFVETYKRENANGVMHHLSCNMIKILNFTKLLILIICVVLGSASSSSAGRFKFSGYSFGLSRASMYGDAIKDTDASHKFGLNVGGFYIHKVNEQFAIQAELNLNSRGIKRKFDIPVLSGNLAVSESISIIYLEIPVLAKFAIPYREDLKPSVFIGASVDLKILGNVKGDYIATGTSIYKDGSIDGKVSNARRLGLTGIIGGDVGFKIGKSQYLLDLRYGISPFNTFSDLETTNSISGIAAADIKTGRAFDLKHSFMSISLGLMFK